MLQKRARFFNPLNKATTAICIILSLFLIVFHASNAQSPPTRLPKAKVLIAYSSVQGHTKKMAEAVANGARSVADAEVTIEDVNKINLSIISGMDAIIVGSPVHNANITPEIQSFINKWPFKDGVMRDKIGAAFVSAGGMSAGEELAQLSILHSMLVFGMIVVGGDNWRSAFGASAIVNESTSPPSSTASTDTISEYYLKKGEMLGKRVARLAVQKARHF